ncbi:hypothetical protein EJ110_NYTH57678 [Nymphaea thermarum]|nr:hypothetical protein EJ110_NYTH57678 [Nymphaea thermarum]
MNIMQEAAVGLLCNLMNLFPSSFHRHYDNAEAVLATMLSRSSAVSKMFAELLAFLPRAKGDAVSWSQMITKALISINIHLNYVFEGFEDGNQCTCLSQVSVPVQSLLALVERMLSLDGNNCYASTPVMAITQLEFLFSDLPMIHLSGLDLLDAIIKGVRSTLLRVDACFYLSHGHPKMALHPDAIGEPGFSTLSTAFRATIVSPAATSSARLIPKQLELYVAVTSNAFYSLAKWLLHRLGVVVSNLAEEVVAKAEHPSLEKRTSGINSLTSLCSCWAIIQLLPATGKIVRLLQSYFQRFSLPSIRAKLYKISKALLMSMNAGMALYFASDIIDNASRDLNYGIQGRGFISFPMLSSKHVTEASNVTKKRKRKFASGGPEDNSNPLEAEFFSDQPNVPFSVLISALQAIEALLMVGGSLRSQSWRPDVDLLLMRMASSACEEGWSYVDSDIIMEEEGSFSWADFQLAALKALLASLLSPCTHRPPYLSYGLALFRKGKQEAGTQIADFCAHALLALESLIHPRSLQLISPPLGGNGDFSQRFDLQVNENRKSHVPFSQEQKSNIPKMNCPSMQKPDKRNLPIDVADIYPDDKLCMGWLANMEENDTDTLYNSKEVQVDCRTESTTFKLNTVEKTQCCLVVDAEGVLKENTRNTSLIVVPQTQVAINATAVDKSAVEGLEGHSLQPPVHMKEGNSGETEGAESKGIEPLKPVASPSKEVVVSAGVSDVVSEDLFFNRFSSYNSEEFAKQSSDSESLPDIVDGENGVSISSRIEALDDEARCMQYPKLRPQLLRSLIADHLPEANTSSFDPLKLPLLITTIKSHRLLSEHYAGSLDEKLQNDWRAAVSLWVERLLLLSSSELPDKCWVSVSLLGVTCQECSGALFLMSYSSWFDKLLELLKVTTSNFVIDNFLV